MDQEQRTDSTSLEGNQLPPIDLPTKKFTGKMHTLVYRPHNGFANYAIMTADLVDGKIKDFVLSQSYAAVEAMIRLEMINERKLEEMRKRYPAGYRHI